MGDTTFVSGRYLSRSWAMMTQDKGWVKPVLLLALCLLVPVAGPIAVMGYAWEWARLTAWGVDSAPKQRGVSVGGCFSAGWRVFVVALVWGLAFALVQTAVVALFDAFDGRVGLVVSILFTVATFFFQLFVYVAELRSSVYEKIAPGFGLKHVWQMATRDFGGLMRVLGIELLGCLVGLVIALVEGVVLVGTVMPVMMGAVSYAGLGYDMLAAGTLSALGSVLGTVLPLLVLFGYAMNLVAVVFLLLAVNSVALWGRQFDVPSWGAPSDPLPAPSPVTAPGAGSWPAPAVPVPVAPNAQTPVDSGYQTPTYQAEEVPAMDFTVDNNGAPVTPPTHKDIYQDAAGEVVDWTFVKEPKAHAVDHLEYKPEPTEPPAPASDNGVTPPTKEEIYVEAAGKVADGPEVGLDDSATAAAEELAGEKLEANAPQTPVTAPTPADIHVTAADAVTAWTSVKEPKDAAVDHLEYKPEPTEPPAPASDNGVTPPTKEEIYVEAAGKVADGPEVGLDDSATAAEEELIEDDVRFSDPASAPVVDAANGEPVAPYMAPADAKGSETDPISSNEDNDI